MHTVCSSAAQLFCVDLIRLCVLHAHCSAGCHGWPPRASICLWGLILWASRRLACEPGCVFLREVGESKGSFLLSSASRLSLNNMFS
jgi:hypothetical protein